MKKLLVLIIALICANVLFAFDTDIWQCEILDESARTVSIKIKPGVQTYKEYSSYTIPTTVRYSQKDWTVTKIASSAFSGCSNATSITIPNTITKIENLAFSGCSSLTSITIPNSVTSIGSFVFQNCSSLTSVTIPNGVTSLSQGVFNNCTALTNVTIPNSVTTISNSAFYGCTALTSVNIPDGVTSIGNAAFAGCSALTSVNIPDGVTKINPNTFNGCRNLTSVTIPNSVTSIKNEAFEGCENLPSITIPNSVTSIEKEAFYGCSALTSVTLSENITSIGNAAFARCSFTSITIGSLDNIEESSSCSIDTNAFRNCNFLTNVYYFKKYAPTVLGFEVFNTTNPNRETTLTLAFLDPAQGDNANAYTYTNLEGATNWKKIKYIIPEGKTKTLTSDLTIKNPSNAQQIELENNGILKIAQGGQLINETSNNNLGIVEVETASLPNDKWSFIAAPFAGYKLESVVPGAHDISISTFNYGTGAWSDEWSTIETQIGAGEGFFAWSYATEPTIFTNYGDGMYSPNAHSDYSDYNYDFNSNPAYQLNNGDVTVTKTLTTNGGNWMALANPYTFKLDVNKFLTDQADCMQGGVSYRFNGTNWVTATTGEINVTEGFFVNFNHSGTHSAFFKKSHRLTASAKASIEREFVRLAMLDGEREIEVLFAQNEQANEEYDIFDANKLFSPVEIAEPYFVVNNIELVKEEVNTLPYYATMNVKSYGNKEVTFKANYIPEGLAVSIIDGEETIDLGEGVEYTTNVIAGENADRFKVLIKKSLSISDVEELEVNIYNDNRHINIESTETDLQVEVYNALGQKVLSTTDRNFALNQVSAGAYVVKAFNSKASKTQKVVVK